MFKFWLMFGWFFVSANANIASSHSDYDIDGLEQEWNQCACIREVIAEWSKKIHKDLDIKLSDVILYPFGGADVVYPSSFFPYFKKLVIIGLEPTGNSFSLDNKDGVISNLRQLFTRGFFVTRDMELFKKNGVLTVMLIQLKKIGASKIEHVIYNEYGYKHLKINFVLDKISREIIYIQANLNDENHARWHKLFDAYPCFTLYLKSASCILHQVGFDNIRLILDQKAITIFQDDTGFTFSWIKKHKYSYNLFGAYYEPYELSGLTEFFQEDLKEAYENIDTVLLPFAIGYRSHRLPYNLLIAQKQ